MTSNESHTLQQEICTSVKIPFTQIPNIIFQTTKVSPQARFLWSYYLRCSGKNFKMSNKIIYKVTGFNKSQYTSCKKELIEHNMIEVKEHPGKFKNSLPRHVITATDPSVWKDVGFSSNSQVENQTTSEAARSEIDPYTRSEIDPETQGENRPTENKKGEKEIENKIRDATASTEPNSNSNSNNSSNNVSLSERYHKLKGSSPVVKTPNKPWPEIPSPSESTARPVTVVKRDLNSGDKVVVQDAVRAICDYDRDKYGESCRLIYLAAKDSGNIDVYMQGLKRTLPQVVSQFGGKKIKHEDFQTYFEDFDDWVRKEVGL